MSAAPASASPRQPWADWLLVGLLAVLMWLPTVDFFTGIDITRQPNENRQPAPIPRLTHLNFAGLQEYVTASELYFNDHFGFRKRLIRWFQQWTWRLFRQQNEGRAEGRSLVYPGQHGWLFFAGQQMMENYMGTDPFTPRQLRAWQKLLEKRRDWLAARGIQYYFVVPPDKHNIYSEELPLWLQKATPAKRETKLDQFERYMQKHSTVQDCGFAPAAPGGQDERAHLSEKRHPLERVRRLRGLPDRDSNHGQGFSRPATATDG